VETTRQVYGIDKPVPVYQREQLMDGHTINGPSLIVERVSTTWLALDWQCTVDSVGNLVLKKT
jgi:N-methylhydantoinase A/oxoprolinase/acetone carboxylase beta subunit